MKDNLIKTSTLIFLSVLTGNVFSYFFQVTMGRMLGVQTFGEMNALFSVMAIFGVPFASITNFLAKKISHYHALELSGRANALILKSYKNLFLAGAAMLLAGILFSGYISECLKFDSAIPVAMLFLIGFVSIMSPVNTGILQGLHKFGMLSFMAVGASVFRYVLCTVFVIIGLQLYGVLAGTLLTALLIGYISFIPIGRHLKKGHDASEKAGDAQSAIFPIFAANVSFAILSQSDVIFVKYFFTPHEAGLYSSAAIIGKAVMYLPGAIVISLFPMVASNKAREEGTLHLLLKALAATLLLSGGGAAVLYLFPGPVVSVFFGDKFAPAAHIVGFFAIAMMPLAVIIVLMNYNMAKGGRYFSYIMLAGSILQIMGVLYFHSSVTDILKVILYVGLLCMVMLFSLLAAEYYKSKMQNLGLCATSGK